MPWRSRASSPDWSLRQREAHGVAEAARDALAARGAVIRAVAATPSFKVRGSALRSCQHGHGYRRRRQGLCRCPPGDRTRADYAAGRVGVTGVDDKEPGIGGRGAAGRCQGRHPASVEPDERS